jgi:hypothetical protein
MNSDPRQRFKKQLAAQLGFLHRSAASYDAGFEDEGVRIATVIRTLFHDTSKSTSLLTHLSVVECQLLSTCPQIGLDVRHFECMTHRTVAGPSEAHIRPALGDSIFSAFIDRKDWWDQVVSVPHYEHRLTRKEIVLVAANRDGGAHVDAALTPAYEALSVVGGDVVWYDAGKQEVARWSPTTIHLAYLRQLSFELLNSPALHALSVGM